MIQIFSADNNWGIGKGNNLLFRVPGDMAFFRGATSGKVVVMGRKTLDSLPGGNPLPQRTNIVLTRDRYYAREDVAVCNGLEDLFARLARYADEDIFIIGGEQIFRQLLPYSVRALVTRWHAEADADAFVPNLDAEPGWRLSERSEDVSEKGVAYHFATYVNAAPKSWRP